MIPKVLKISSSVYQCNDIIQGEIRNPLIGALPFSRYVLKPKMKSPDFGGAGLYACFFKDRLIYIGKYLGQKNDFRSGNIISLRWVKHIGTFTMMERNLSFSKKALGQINQALESQTDIIPQPISDAFPAVSSKVLSRDRGCTSTYARFDVAAHIWKELGRPTLNWLEEFSFIYTRIDTDLPRVEVRQLISRAENIVVSQLCPPGNSIKSRFWRTYSKDDVFEAFTDSLSYSHENTSGSVSFSGEDLLKTTINEPEEESYYMEFEKKMENAPSFAKEFIERVKQEFDTIDNASIEYTKCPDMRIRKLVDTERGFINAATISWQPTKKCFLLATALGQGDAKLFGLTVDKLRQRDPLPSVLYLDETIINQKRDDIINYLKDAHKNR